MIFYGRQYIDKFDEKAVISALKSSKITQGPKVEQFEKLLSRNFGSKYCCAVSNGTSGLHLAGLALGWKKNDIILCSPISFLAASNAAIYCNSRPDFVDINKDNFNIDLEKLEKKILHYKKKGKKIKTIVATDFGGNPCNWKRLSIIGKKYKIKLINDNCHALGAKYKGKKSYAAFYADIVVHSYHAVKNITTGEGGAVLTNNKDINDKVRILRSHGVVKNKTNSEPWNYEMRFLGYNYRISDIQCSLGISQLKKLNNFVKKRNAIAKIYKEAFSGEKLFKTQEIRRDDYNGYHLFPLLIDFKNSRKKKLGLFKYLKKKHIHLQVHYTPIHLQPFYVKKFGYKKGDFPIAENFFKNEISLPIYYNLELSKVKKITSMIKNYILK